ncbi:MAG: dihydrolipoyllysine-residue succinyltransferase [Desulfuromonadales bacterium]
MEIKVPAVGESIHEATIAKWHKQNGETVRKDDILCELETDKITLEVNAEADGVLSIAVGEGETVEVGALIGTIEDGAAAEKAPAKKGAKEEEKPAAKQPEPPAAPANREEPKEERPAPRTEADRQAPLEPAPARQPAQEPSPARAEQDGRTTRQPMSSIRRRIAERLVAVQQQTAMLTTFNEADMTRVLELRRKHRESFVKRHGVPLGLMSFFVKACIEALKEFPEVNGRIDGNDIVLQHFYDIGIAVGTERGLVVPVLRDADRLYFAQIEQQIRAYAEKAQNNKLALADLEGGTFTISNGGVYGSLLSTPILNPPQSGVLGMHAIQERPVARDGKVVIRPMMNLALSYDHRIIDGRQAVGYLKRVKEFVEEPEEMLLEM